MSQSRVMNISSRMAAALFGGYALSYFAATAAAISLVLLTPITKAEAVVTTVLAALLIYPLAILYAFHASSARRAWLGLFVALLPCLAVSIGYEIWS